MSILDKFKGIGNSKSEKEEVVEKPVVNNIAVGLDIGTTKVVAFAGKRGSDGKIKILGTAMEQSVGVERGLVLNILETSDVVKRVIAKTQKSANLSIDTVMVGIAGQHMKTQRVNSEIKLDNANVEISKEDVKKLIDEAFNMPPMDGTSKILDVIPQEFIVDTYPPQVNPIGMMGKKMSSECNVISGNIQHIKNIGRCMQTCNLKMDALILEPLASAEVVLNDDEKEAGVALVDIGGGTTDIVIFTNGVLRHSCVIPIAGDAITKDIVGSFGGIVKREAELLKINHGSCIVDESDKTIEIKVEGINGREPKQINKYILEQVIEARTRDIIKQVKLEIQNSGYSGKLGCGIVFTGGGAQLKGLKEFAEFETGYTVKIGEAKEKIDDPENEYSNPIYATGLGLLVLGVERAEEEYGPSVEEVEENEEEFVEDTHSQKDDKEYVDDEGGETEKKEPKQKNPRGRKIGEGIGRSWGKIQEALVKALTTSIDDTDDDDDF